MSKIYVSQEAKIPLINHANIGEVQKTAYLVGTITSVDSEFDTACFTGIGACPPGSDIPIFYHCEPDSELRSNGALEGASGAFAEDDEVIIQCEITGANTYVPLKVMGFTDKPKSCLWEPWNTDLDDQYNFATTNPWAISYISPPGRQPWTMVNGFLDYNITTGHDVFLNDGLDCDIRLMPDKYIPIPDQELYFNITSTIGGGGPLNWAYSYLFLLDEHDNRLFVVFSDTNFEDRDWSTVACDGIYIGDNDGKNPINISCLSDSIKYLAIETGYDDNMTGYHHSDFISFK